MTAQSTPSFAPVTSTRQAAGIAWRWAATFSRLRAWWPPAGTLARPGLWLVYLTLIGLHAGDVVHRSAAAALVPHRSRRPSHRIYPALAVSLLVILAVDVVLGLWAVPMADTAVWLTVHTLGVLLLLLVAAAGIDIGLGLLRGPSRLGRHRRMLHQQTGRPVTIGSMFGAWPRHSGDGVPLLTAVLAELRADRVILLVVARTEELADWYVDTFGGSRIDPDHPLLVAWL